MTTYNEQEAMMQGVAERFAKAAEELRLTGRQLYREGIVANDQVLSKIKNGWQKPTKKAIELFCQKYTEELLSAICFRRSGEPKDRYL